MDKMGNSTNVTVTVTDRWWMPAAENFKMTNACHVYGIFLDKVRSIKISCLDFYLNKSEIVCFGPFGLRFGCSKKGRIIHCSYVT